MAENDPLAQAFACRQFTEPTIARLDFLVMEVKRANAVDAPMRLQQTTKDLLLLAHTLANLADGRAAAKRREKAARNGKVVTFTSPEAEQLADAIKDRMVEEGTWGK